MATKWSDISSSHLMMKNSRQIQRGILSVQKWRKRKPRLVGWFSRGLARSMGDQAEACSMGHQALIYSRGHQQRPANVFPRLEFDPNWPSQQVTGPSRLAHKRRRQDLLADNAGSQILTQGKEKKGPMVNQKFEIPKK